MLKTHRPLLRFMPFALAFGSTLLILTPVVQAQEQAARVAHQQHLLMLFPAGVAVLTLLLILWNRRK